LSSTDAEIEARELAELNRRFPPDPNHPLKASIEAWSRAAQESRSASTAIDAPEMDRSR
jgi:hypothetical protein